MDIILEKLNVSDDLYLLNELMASNGDYVNKDDYIFSIESSKITIDIQAPTNGYIYFVNGLEDGMELPVGFLIAKIVDEPINPFEFLESEKKQMKDQQLTTIEDSPKDPLNHEFVITDGARVLLNQMNLDESAFYGKAFVCKKDVINLCKQRDLFNYGYSSSTRKIAIIGAGSGAVQVIDLIRSLKNYVPVVIFDDTVEKQGKNLDGVPIVGSIDFKRIKELYIEGIFDYIINSISTHIPFRKSCFEILSGLSVPYCNLIHPSCIIGSNVILGTGNILFPYIHVGADTVIGNDNFITAKASIEHHNKLGSHCTFGPGVMTSGHVEIGDLSRFGAGIFVEPFVEIGINCLIASGSVLTTSVPSNSIVRHNPNIEIVKKRIRS